MALKDILILFLNQCRYYVPALLFLYYEIEIKINTIAFKYNANDFYEILSGQ